MTISNYFKTFKSIYRYLIVFSGISFDSTLCFIHFEFTKLGLENCIKHLSKFILIVIYIYQKSIGTIIFNKRFNFKLMKKFYIVEIILFLF